MVEDFAHLVAFPEISMTLGKLRNLFELFVQTRAGSKVFPLAVPRTVKMGVAGRIAVRLQTMQNNS